jgi:arginine repressor
MRKGETMNNAELSKLIRKIKDGKATKSEKDEYMEYMYSQREISQNQYDEYVKNRNNEAIVNIAIVAGAAVLLGFLLNELTKK